MRFRRLVLAVTTAALAAVGAVLASPEAHADAHDGECTDALGVTVVVDFQELGGGTVVRCVTDLPADATGLTALHAAGFTTQGTYKDGDAFVCRIDGRPAATEDLQVAGQAYREACRETSPSFAFWSYWHAPNGGDWTFSSRGGKGRRPIPGGYEGWSFSLGNTDDTNPAPRLEPSHPLVAPTPTRTTPPPTVAPTRPATPAPPASRPGTPATPGRTASATPRPTRTTTAPTASSTRSTAATPRPTATRPPTPSVASPSPTPTPTPSVTPTPSPSPSASTSPTELPSRSGSTTAPGATPAAATAAPVPAELPPGGPGLGTIAGVGVVAVLGAASGVMLWRRRRLL